MPTFDQLSREVKEKALSSQRYWDVEWGEWHENAETHIKEIASQLGIQIDELRFSGFCSQGDGASFTGSYSHVPDKFMLVLADHPEDTKLHRIAMGLAAEQARHENLLEAVVKDITSHYYHEFSVSVDTTCTCARCWDVCDDPHEELVDLLRAFMCWAYREIETEYEYLTSDEHLSLMFTDLETQFNERGELK